MRNLYAIKTGLLAAICVTLVGCATSRSEVKLTEPAATTASASPSKNKTVLIRDVTDERIFEVAPKSPSTPSLGFEGAANSTAEVKARAIARKRNGFGQALGDVLLENGMTVTQVIRSNLGAALKQAGYQVANDAASAGASPIVMDVRIKKFWAWFTPGFFAVTVGNQISTDLIVEGSKAPTVVSVETSENHMGVTDGTWVEDIDKALTQYRSEAAARTATLN